MKTLLIIFLGILVGCTTQIGTVGKSWQQMSSIEKAEQSVQNGNWEIAYRFLEDGFDSSIPETNKKAIAIFDGYPKIRSAALETFSVKELDGSIVRYGAQNAAKIEANRLKLYMMAASPADSATAKNNMDRVFGRLQEREAEKEVEKKAEKARKDEAKLQAQRLLTTAAEKARFTCKDRLECDKAFSLAQIFIVSNSDMKIQVANDTVLETYNPTEEMKIAMKAIKMPRAGTSAEIVLSVSCKDDNKVDFIDICNRKKLSAYSAFPIFMQENLIK